MSEKKLRGKALTKEIERLCQEYVDKDPRVAKLSRSLIQRRLGQNSRSTFTTDGRGQIIDYYIEQQRKNFNITKGGKKKRSYEEKIAKLKVENEMLKRERDQAIADNAAILNGLKMKGIDPSDVFYPIFDPNG